MPPQGAQQTFTDVQPIPPAQTFTNVQPIAGLKGLVSDPDFQKLDPASQRQALARVSGDNSFSGLSDSDTQQFIQRMAPQQTLAQMVRAKYPGAYDDIDDQTLESKILAKYPQYADLPRTQPSDPYSDLNALRQQSMQQSQNQRLQYFDQNMHGAIPFPTASPAANRAYNAQWNSKANPVTHAAGGYVAPQVPAGMEDAANVAEKLPQVAGAAAAVPFAGAFPLKAAGGVTGAAGGNALGRILFRNASPQAQAMASDIGGAAGGTAGTMIAPDGLPDLSDIRNGIARTFRNPETGALKSGVRTGARVAGWRAADYSELSDTPSMGRLAPPTSAPGMRPI